MSDAIREAFEAIEQSVACGDMSAAQVFTQMKQLISRDSERPGKDSAVQQAQIWAQEARTQKGIVEEIGKLVGCSNDWEMVAAVKAALQSSQTAPAVPELRELVKQYRDAVDYSHEVRRNSHSSLKLNVALAGQEAIERQIDAMLAAAPQPDHSPDAGKVVDECRRVLDRLNSSDPDFDDCADAAALIVRLQSELSGPDGFATWKDAALHERKMRLSTDAGKVVQGEPVGWHGKPDQPGRYEVRGFNDEGTIGLVSVALDDGDLVCNLHDRSTAEVSEFNYFLSDIDDDFEWRTLYTRPAESREEIHRLGQQLYEAARCLGCAQAGGNPDAAEHWSLKAEAILARLRAAALLNKE